MSAFIVKNKTINIVVNWLDHEVQKNDVGHIIKELESLGFPMAGAEWKDMLAHRMYEMNYKAVEQRYGRADDMTIGKFSYELADEAPLVQVYKSLQCWLYQCTEGNVSKMNLYRLFDNEIQKYLAYEIISGLQTYDSATWD